MVEVTDLRTGNVYSYNLDPVDAVITAYYQHAMRRNNLKDSDFRKAPVRFNSHTVACGDFVSLYKRV